MKQSLLRRGEYTSITVLLNRGPQAPFVRLSTVLYDLLKLNVSIDLC